MQSRFAAVASIKTILPFLVFILLLQPAPARCQTTLSGEVALLGANALVGGLTAGVGALVRGESFLAAFGEGAAGGSLQYAGKRLMAADVPAAGLVGRVVGATGASVVLNGASGRGLLDRLALPIGPMTLYWTRTPDSAAVAARLNLGRGIFLIRTLLLDDLRLNWSETLSAGTPVFEAPGRIIVGPNGSVLGGVEMWGTVSLSDPGLLPPQDYRRLVAHERVHVVQDDFLSVAVADPLDDWLLERVPGGDVVGRFVDPGVAYVAIAGALLWAIPYEARPWEREAEYLETAW